MEFDDILLAPFQYLCQIRGKQIRGKLALAFNHWLKIPADKLAVITEVVQMLHNASLMIDDIEDGSILRRGIPVAHHIFGTPMTINTANYVYFLALEKTMTLKEPKAVEVFTQQLLELHRGQGMEIHWRDTVTCPTLEQYRQMVVRKTGGLFGLAIKLMQIFSENKMDFGRLVDDLGLYFQIRDDYCNLRDSDYTDQKSYCEDLTEGKFSFPIIHGIVTHPADQQVINILRQRTTDVEVKKYCVNLLQSYGCFDATKAELVNLEKSILDQVEKCGHNPHFLPVIEELRKTYS